MAHTRQSRPDSECCVRAIAGVTPSSLPFLISEVPLYREWSRHRWGHAQISPISAEKKDYTLTLHPARLYTLNPTPCILHPVPQIQNPVPCTRSPKPYSPNVTPHTLNPTPHTLHPTTCTLTPNPYPLHPIPHTLRPTPNTIRPTVRALGSPLVQHRTPSAPVIKYFQLIHSLETAVERTWHT